MEYTSLDSILTLQSYFAKITYKMNPENVTPRAYTLDIIDTWNHF